MLLGDYASVCSSYPNSHSHIVCVCVFPNYNSLRDMCACLWLFALLIKLAVDDSSYAVVTSLTDYRRMTHICVTRANVVNREGHKYASNT